MANSSPVTMICFPIAVASTLISAILLLIAVACCGCVCAAQAVEDMCRHQMQDRLYNRLQAECDAHISQQIAALQAKTQMAPAAFLERVSAAWDDHCSQMLLIRSIFLYLDRTYVMGLPGTRSLFDTGLACLRKHLAAHPNVGPAGSDCRVLSDVGCNCSSAAVISRHVLHAVHLHSQLVHCMSAVTLLLVNRQHYVHLAADAISTSLAIDHLFLGTQDQSSADSAPCCNHSSCRLSLIFYVVYWTSLIVSVRVRQWTGSCWLVLCACWETSVCTAVPSHQSCWRRQQHSTRLRVRG